MSSAVSVRATANQAKLGIRNCTARGGAMHCIIRPPEAPRHHQVCRLVALLLDPPPAGVPRSRDGSRARRRRRRRSLLPRRWLLPTTSTAAGLLLLHRCARTMRRLDAISTSSCRSRSKGCRCHCRPLRHLLHPLPLCAGRGAVTCGRHLSRCRRGGCSLLLAGACLAAAAPLPLGPCCLIV